MKFPRTRSRRRSSNNQPHAAHSRPNRRRLFLESLEERRVMATLTWVGDVDADWGTNNAGNTNWSGNALPADGDTLVFDGTGATFALNNDIAGLDNLHLEFTDAAAGGDYSVAGNAIGIDSLSSSVTVGTGVTITAPLELDEATVPVTVAAGQLALNGALTGNSALDITGSGATRLGGTVSIGDLSVAGSLTIAGGSLTTTGDQTYDDPVILDTAGNATTLAGDNITFNSTVRSLTDGEEALTVTAGGVATFAGAVGDNNQSLASLTVNGPGTTTISGGSVTTAGSQTYANAVTLTSATDFSATGAAGTIAFATSLAAGANNVTLSAREINLPAVANSVSGTAAITIQPEADATPINVGGAADAGAGSLDFTAADIAALAGGFSLITIGRSAGTATLAITGAAAFGDALTLRASGAGGAIAVGALLSTAADADAGALTLVGSGATTTLNGNVVTAGAPITISDSIELGAAAITLDTTGGGAAPAGANVTLTGPGTVTDVGAASALVISAGTAGDVTLDGAIGSPTAIAALTITGNNVVANGPISTTGPISIAAQNAVTLHAAVNATASTITIAANQDGANAQSLDMNVGSSLTTTNDTATAVVVTVNTALGGTGAANVRAISAGTTAGPAGGRITINANNGAILDADTSATNNLTAGNAILTAAAGIGTAGDAIETTLGRLEAAADAAIHINESSGLTIGGITAGTGIATLGDDVRLVVGGSLIIDADMNLAGGNLLLEIAVNVSQNAGDTIAAGGLALDVDGTTTLTEANDVDFLAANTGGTIDFTDADSLTIRNVTVLGVSLPNLTTSGDDVRLTVGGDLLIDDDIILGAGNLLLDVAGNVDQAAGDTISAAGLALVVTGTTTLTEANDVDFLAADAGGTIDFTDADALTVRNVTVLATATPDFRTSGDDVRLTAGGDLVIDDDIDLAAGSLLLDVTGNVTQNAGDTVVASGLALAVTGTTTLTQANNNVAFLAADTGGTIDLVDLGNLTVRSVTVLAANIPDLQTSGDDVRLTVAGDLVIDDDIALGAGGLLVDAGGNVSQNADDTIVANRLALAVTGTTTLTEANNVALLAADTGGTIDYTDVNSLAVDSVTVLGATITGLTTSDDDVRLAVGSAAGHNLAINQPIDLDATAAAGGDLLLDVGGNVTQSGLGTLIADGLALLVDGPTTLTLAGNDVNTLAADTGDEICFVDADDLTVDSVTVLAATVNVLQTNSANIEIIAGTSLDLHVLLSSGSADTRLLAGAAVSQLASGNIVADELGVRAETGISLIAATATNDVNQLAARSTTGNIAYGDSDDLVIESVTAGACGFVATAGVVALDGDVLIQTQDTAAAGEDLTVSADVLAGELPADNDRSLTLLAGDDLTIDAGVNVAATGAVTIAGDTGGAVDAAGSAITILGASGIIAGDVDVAGAADVTILGNVNQDHIRLSPDRIDVALTPLAAFNSNALAVELGLDEDRITLDYSGNFGWLGGKTVLNINGGADGVDDVLDLDQTADTLPRKRQFAYIDVVGTNTGTDVNLVSDVGTAGGDFDNNDNFCVELRAMDRYVVRAGSADLDQTILIGQQGGKNEITVGNIEKNPAAGFGVTNADPHDDLPMAGSTAFSGRARFGVSGTELLRTIGGTKVDTIITDIEPVASLPVDLIPSGATFNILEGQGGFNAIAEPGELLHGSEHVVNLFFGAGVGPLKGRVGASGPVGVEPARARLIGGAGNGVIGDYYLSEHRRAINADGTAADLVQVAGGDFRDLVMGAHSTAVSLGGNDRAAANGSVAGSGPVNIFMNGEIDVILWLQARFPGPGEQEDVTSGGNVTGSAESLVAAFDHNFVRCAADPLPGPNQGPGPGPGPVGPSTPPVIGTFTVPAAVNVGQSASLSATATDPDNASEPLKFLWTITAPDLSEFTLTGPSPSFLVRDVGNYLVRLDVTDSTNATSTQFGAIVANAVASNVIGSVVAGKLTLTGTGDRDDLVLTLGSGGPNTVLVTGKSGTLINGAASELFVGLSAGVLASLGDGADRVRVEGSQLSKVIRIESGSGDDEVEIASTGATLTLVDPAGRDLIDLAGMSARATLDLSLTTFQTLGAGNKVKLAGTQEDLIGTAFADSLKGNGAANEIFGLGGNDTISGKAGGDVLDGGDGHDNLRGDGGNDRLLGGSGNDTLDGGAGRDILLGGLGSDTLRGGSQRDLLIGGLGFDKLFGGSDQDILTGGTTSNDDYDLALSALLAEWSAAGSTAARADRLRTGQTAGNFALAIHSVQVDGSKDQLSGESSNDWLLAPIADQDKLLGVKSGDIVDR